MHSAADLLLLCLLDHSGLDLIKRAIWVKQLQEWLPGSEAAAPRLFAGGPGSGEVAHPVFYVWPAM